jgi:Zn-dependent peptidase ImmA (M78 family)
VDDVGSIMISNRLTDPGDRRFAIAHELGHWRMHGAISQLFFCTDSDMKEYRHSGQELEANTFASELLMPKAMIDLKTLTAEPSWDIVRGLSEKFSVAPISAAVRYAELAHQPVIAVFSDGRNVQWWRENRARMDGLWLESRQPISEQSVVYHEAGIGGADASLCQVPWEAWFPHINPREDEELWEFSACLDGKGTMLSLLWVPSRG